MDTQQQETVRQIAKREYDAVNSNGIYNSTGTLGWSIWKRAYDSAAVNLSNHQAAIEEFRHYLGTMQDKLHAEGLIEAFSAITALRMKYSNLFPPQQIQVPTECEKQALSDEPGYDGSPVDDTDKLYPR